jgi:hypothetical protein
MISINRTAIIVRPGQPFLEWLHRADPTSREFTLEEVRHDPNVYLIPECENDEEVREYLEDACGPIFEEILDGWYRVPSTWPKRRDLEEFERWFEWSVHYMVVDLSDEPLLQEEL